ncbi:MAG TPA: UbiD family decarboxylase [Chloroflexi bacterium]|nr:UbiD family decarboxylase [Chloroflexota bacterium]
MNLRHFVAWAQEQEELLVVDSALNPHLEMARAMHALDGRPVLFNALTGHPNWRALSGVCARREHFAVALGCRASDLVHRMAEALANPAPPALTSGEALCQEVAADRVDLTHLPIPRYHARDGGRYVTSGIAVIEDPDYGRNVAFHRLMILDARRVAARIVENRGTHTAWAKTDRDVPVAIAIGCPIQVLLAAAMSPPKGVDELAIAQAMAPTPLAACQTVDLAVPAEAEIILEGRITHTLADEGPFPDLTETMDVVRRQPVIEIDRFTHRRAPIFHALLPGGMEHKHLMGMPREPTIFAAVDEVCRCTGVYITPGGASWLHVVVQIEKQHDDDGQKAIEAAFRGHSSLKHVVIVDTDIDIYDSTDVEWAIATRFQADRDLRVFTDQPSSSLDPSATQIPGEKSRTAKMGLDATAPLNAARKAYQKVEYEALDLSQYNLKRGTTV